MISRRLTADPFRQDTEHKTGLQAVYQKVVISILVFVPLAATVYAIYATWGRLVDWLDLTLLFVLYLLVGLGVTIGFHRYLAHGSFKTNTAAQAAAGGPGDDVLAGRPDLLGRRPSEAPRLSRTKKVISTAPSLAVIY